MKVPDCEKWLIYFCHETHLLNPPFLLMVIVCLNSVSQISLIFTSIMNHFLPSLWRLYFTKGLWAIPRWTLLCLIPNLGHFQMYLTEAWQTDCQPKCDFVYLCTFFLSIKIKHQEFDYMNSWWTDKLNIDSLVYLPVAIPWKKFKNVAIWKLKAFKILITTIIIKDICVSSRITAG